MYKYLIDKITISNSSGLGEEFICKFHKEDIDSIILRKIKHILGIYPRKKPIAIQKDVSIEEGILSYVTAILESFQKLYNLMNQIGMRIS